MARRAKVNDLAVENTTEALKQDIAIRNEIIQSLYRRSLLSGLNGEVNTTTLNRDYDSQFGYPEVIDKFMYKKLFDRNAIANRVVSIYPTECWLNDPDIYDAEAPSNSEFERAIAESFELHDCYGMLKRVDILSGIGCYGVLLLGISDGKDLGEPVEGVEYLPKELKQGKFKLLYIRPFAHSQIEIAQLELDVTNPRYGQPTLYRIQFNDPDQSAIETGAADFRTINVHWTRILHLADNRHTSEIFGLPRMQVVYNNVLDTSKLVGSSAEMFYKGAYPGFSVEAVDDVTSGVQLDLEAMRKQIALYENGLQRWFGLTNAHVNSLSPQVQSPADHVNAQLDLIALAMACPKRIFFGSERGDLASSQDTQEWNKQLMVRMRRYLTPFVIKPFVRRLIQIGELPVPKDGKFSVQWADLNMQSDQAKYEVANSRINIASQYLSGNLDELICPEDFMQLFLHMTDKEARDILARAKKWQAEKATNENSDDDNIENLGILNLLQHEKE